MKTPTIPFLKKEGVKSTIAFDFDGVIHRYRKGWLDGSIYDEANIDILQYMVELVDAGHPVFIFSTRSPLQIVKWMNDQYPWCGARAFDTAGGVEAKVIMPWVKFWNTTRWIGVTKRKLPASVYIDDRAVKFDGDIKTLKLLVSA